MSAIAWSAAEDAIHDWVVGASGLATTSVIWWGQSAPRPETPYILLQIDSVDQVGSDWIIYDAAPDSEAGAELRKRARGHRTARLQLQCFGADASSMEAGHILVDVISGLALYLDDLDLAGVGIADSEPVQLAEGRRGGIFEPRAVTAVNLHFASEVEARSTYVERMNLVINESTIGEVADLWIPDPPPPES